ncbi:MAG: stage III sporulation protein AC [Lachnospiraceae bacterium]
MEVGILFKIAAVGLLITLLSQVLKHSGRDELAFLSQLVGFILVISWIIPYILELFDMIEKLLGV